MPVHNGLPVEEGGKGGIVLHFLKKGYGLRQFWGKVVFTGWQPYESLQLLWVAGVHVGIKPQSPQSLGYKVRWFCLCHI